MNRHALIVDDDPVVRMLLEALLRKAGWATTTAEDGRVAVEVIATTSFDVVVSDVKMPKLDGPGLLAELRAQPRTRDLPFVLLSASHERPAVVEARRLAFLTKPVNPRTFAADLIACLDAMSATDSSG